jgi:hypothetical protein
MTWLPEPPPGTQIALGFDGADTNDHAALRAETRSGYLFTPRYGPDLLPCHWNPEEWGGQVPRTTIDGALREVVERFKVGRGYFDPPHYETQIEQWALDLGDDIIVPWYTQRYSPMHAALVRFVTDLQSQPQWLTHDGCPITAIQIGNARKIVRGRQYILGKPSDHQKIDAAMAEVLAHEAASDLRAEGWPDEEDSSVFCFT